MSALRSRCVTCSKFERVNKDEANAAQKPNCIIVFRGGVSDGELPAILDREVNELERYLRQYSPATALCYIVVRVLLVFYRLQYSTCVSDRLPSIQYSNSRFFFRFVAYHMR